MNYGTDFISGINYYPPPLPHGVAQLAHRRASLWTSSTTFARSGVHGLDHIRRFELRNKGVDVDLGSKLAHDRNEALLHEVNLVHGK